MARGRKNNRTPQEEEEYRRERRKKLNEYQRRYRATQRDRIVEQRREIIQISEHYSGPMNVLCIHCGARHFLLEKVANKGCSFNDCCSHGEVKVDLLNDFPAFLKRLLNGEDENSNNFFQNIRYYNNSLSFASFNANLRDFSGNRPGPYCFVVHGQVYYQINTSFYADSNDVPTNGQLFIIDQEEAIAHRMNQHSNLNDTVLRQLDDFIRKNNVQAKSYQMMNDEIQTQKRRCEELGITNTQELHLMFTLKPGMHPGRYNAQQSNEVAAIFSTSADGEIPEAYVTIRVKSTKSLKCVSSMDPNVEPWIYPIFYPTGKQGWHRNIQKQNSDRRVSRNQYVKNLLAIRDDEFNPYIRGRRLFQQWVVDNYVKVEKDKIEWCKNNQKTLRADTYKNLKDSLERRASENHTRLGKIVVLPSTFIGSPRNMLQNYQDAMAIVRKYHKPDLFITMTCNPNWKEITENLLPGQTPADRPDLVARVFNLKKDHLLHLIKEEEFFGKVLAYIYVIEFQKRGLPHMHLLVILANNCKLDTAEKVDKFISAQIPTDDDDLQVLVLKHMIHNCGNWCQVNGTCSKRFPMMFQSETTFDENSIPQYRRQNTGQTFLTSNNKTVDNRDVVSHNGSLLKIFNCHINVVACSSLLSVKYLFKYVYKGHDRAAVYIQDNCNESASNSDNIINHDETKQFIDSRYVGASEACWRILEKKMHGRSHSIIRLPIHLPNEQNIYINDECDLEDFMNNLNKETMLQAFFELNASDETARDFLYMDIPNHFTFDKKSRKWHLRKNHFNVIGRIYSVSPSQTELFHLRLLLLKTKGARSFKELKTVEGHEYATFVETCLALGLIENDDEWRKAMQEAVIWMMPRQLRFLFVSILIHCHPINPHDLWNEFKSDMSEDFSRNCPSEIAENKAYAHINAILTAEGKSLADFPQMNQHVEEDIDFGQNRNMSIENCALIGEMQYKSLNAKQKEIVDKVLTLAEHENLGNQNRDKTYDNCIYINGIGGSGKTFIYSTLYCLLKVKDIDMTSMAFTGIAAILLPEGKTIHKTFQLPVPLHKDSTSNIKLQSKEALKLKNDKIFVLDEALMAPRYALECIDRTLKDIMNNNLPFGGKIMILGGDDRQLLPVKESATKSEIIDLSVKSSHLWRNFKKYTLTENMRVIPQEKEFCEFVKNVGDGVLNDTDDNIHLPIKTISANSNDIVNEIYGNLVKEQKFNELANTAILTARNIDVDEINDKVLDLFDESSEKIFYSVDSIDDSDGTDDVNDTIQIEFLNTLSPRSLPPHELRLRKNCTVMLLRNINCNEGLCNGTRLEVLDFSDHIIKGKILNGDKAGDVAFIHRITLICNDKYPFSFKRRQFPIRLAFAMSINKAQGQTLKKIGIDLRKDVFTHGQLYVALSRVRSEQGLTIFVNESNGTNNKVKNIVFKEIFDV